VLKPVSSLRHVTRVFLEQSYWNGRFNARSSFSMLGLDLGICFAIGPSVEADCKPYFAQPRAANFGFRAQRPSSSILSHLSSCFEPPYAWPPLQEQIDYRAITITAGGSRAQVTEMAEAVALGASIIAIYQIADRIIGLCKFYIETIHDAPSDIRKILVEMSALKAIFQDLEFLK
jgi:hypothetical protein